MKQCTSCKQELPLINFRLVRRSNRPDEIFCKCRTCEKEYYKLRRRERAEVETERTRVWREANPEKARTASNRWKDYNKGSCLRIGSERRAREKNATVSWFEKEEVTELYTRAQELGYHVDHIVPLTHKLVCGLHCLANLQLLSPVENLKKGNRFMI